MANDPQGDIELLFRSNPLMSMNVGQPTLGKNPQGYSMRIRFLRQAGTIEISRYVLGTRGEEWTKKVMASTAGSPQVAATDRDALDPLETKAMHQLFSFLRICEAIDVLDDSGYDSHHTPSNTVVEKAAARSNDTLKGYYKATPTVPGTWPAPIARNISISNKTTASKSLSSVNLAPRPPKLSKAPIPRSTSGKENQDLLRNRRSISNSTTGASQSRSMGIAETTLTWSKATNDSTDLMEGIQTRFIPFVGWCIRLGSRVSQGGRFKVMFLDGEVLEVDVDEEWVELTSRSGQSTRQVAILSIGPDLCRLMWSRHRIHECNTSRISERMKVFEEFIPLFDEG